MDGQWLAYNIEVGRLERNRSFLRLRNCRYRT